MAQDQQRPKKPQTYSSNSKKQKGKAKPRSVLLERLEPRVMFDAAANIDPDMVVESCAAANELLTPAQSFQNVSAHQQNTSEFVFIDSRIDEIDSLIGDLLNSSGGSLEIHVLNSDQDGLLQISAALDGREQIDSIHIFSHGSAGQIELGATLLNADNMADQYAAQLSVIGKSLTTDGDILIYGCDFAKGESGLRAVDLLAEVTGADVAASDDLTGSAALGGDWDLEYSYGGIDSSTLKLALGSHWEGVLAAGQVNFENVTWTSGALTGTVNNTETGNEDVKITVSGDTGQIGSGPTVDRTNTGGFGNPNGTSLYTLADFSNPNQSLTYDINFAHAGGVDGVSFSLFDIDSLVGGFGDQVTVTASTDGGTTYNLNPTTITGSTFNQVINANTIVSLDQSNATGGDDTRGNAFFSFSQSGITDIRIVYKYPDAGTASDPDQQAMSLHDISFTYFQPPFVDLDGNDAPATGNYRDDFTDGDYQNQPAGSLAWTGDWVEFGDGGAAQSPAEGDIQIVNDGGSARLRIKDNDLGVRREANLSGYDTATLNFDFRRQGLDGASDYVAIEIATDGVNYTEIGRISGAGTDSSYQSFSLDISSYISPTTTIRFASSSSLGNNDIVFFDNINIALTAAPQTSFSNTFVENGPAVAISASGGLGTIITDPDSTQLSKAVIRLQNPFAGDALSVFGALPSGITTAITTTTLGNDTITLTGAATLANYKAAIQQLRYSSSSDAPNTTPRQVAVVVTDQTGRDSNTAISTISVTAVNDAPVLNSTSTFSVNAIDEDTNAPAGMTVASLIASVAGDAITDPDTGAVEGIAVTGVNNTNGTWQYSTDGSTWLSFGSVSASNAVLLDNSALVRFVPAANYAGTSNFSFVAWDQTSGGNGQTGVNASSRGGATAFSTAFGTASIDVVAVADTPNLTVVNASGNEDTAIPLAISASLVDTDGSETLSITISGVPAGAIFSAGTDNGGGNWSFTPAQLSGLEITPPLNRQTDFTLTVTATATESLNSDAKSTQETLQVSITPVNDDFSDADETVSTDEDTPLSGNVIDGSSVDGPLSVVDFTVAGDVTVYAAGDTATIAGVGTLTIGSGGAYTFTPVADYNGPVPLVTYTLTDGSGADDTSTLAITVNAVNDSPVAVDDAGSTTQLSTVTIDVTANDTDADGGDTLSVTATAISSGSGTVSFSGSDVIYDPEGAYDYLPAGETATVVIDYTVDDANGGTDVGQLTITVMGTNDGPVAIDDSAITDEDSPVATDVITNDYDIDVNDECVISAAAIRSGLGSISVSGNQILYSPDPSYNSLAVGQSELVVIEYQVTDLSGATDTAQLMLTVMGTNDGPVMANATVSTQEDVTVTGDASVLASDIDGDQLQFKLQSPPANGTALVNSDGTYSYTPAPNYYGQDSFVIEVNDGHGGTAQAVITVNVAPVIDIPFGTDDLLEVPVNTTTTIDVLANDIDPDGLIDQTTVQLIDPASGSLVSTLSIPGQGTYTVDSATGQIIFKPVKDFQGAVTPVQYNFDDSTGARSAAITLQVVITNGFAYDSFNNMAYRFGNQPGFRGVAEIGILTDSSNPYLSQTIGPQLAPAPIFSGFAQPGTQIIGRLYDEFGNIVGEARAQADLGGNWMVQFQQIQNTPYQRIVIEYVAGSTDNDARSILGGSENRYQAMQSLTEYNAPLSVSKVFNDAARESVADDHRENVNPVGWSK